MEINICNTDANSRIVLNDLQLLEQLYLYPFLLSKAVVGHGDKDYTEWSWQQIVRDFNLSYQGLELSTPFTVEELQWRWEILRPICPSLGKACGQIPDALWYVICKINRLLSCKPSARVKPPSAAKQLILNQLPMVEQLTESQQRRLEVEVLDAILSHERSVLLEPPSQKTKDIVQYQYNEFLKAIRIKELPVSSVSHSGIPESSSDSPTASKELSCTLTNGIDSSNDNSNAASSCDSNLVISNVCGQQESLEELPPIPSATPPLDFKAEPYQLTSVQQQSAKEVNSTHPAELRFVPLKSAKYYTKKLKVKVKRMDFQKYLALTQIKADPADGILLKIRLESRK